jgi:hypothetical protein
MKKILLTCLAMFIFVLPSFSQANKNCIALGLSFDPRHNESIYPGGGGIPFAIQSTDKGIGVSPSVGWYASKNFELGISAYLGNQNLNSGYDTLFSGIIKNSGGGINLFGIKYFPINNFVSFFISSGISYHKTHSEYLYHYPDRDISQGSKSHGYGLGFSSGISFFPIKRLQLSASVGNLSAGWSISRDKDTNEITEKGWNYNFRFDLSTIVFGINYLL